MKRKRKDLKGKKGKGNEEKRFINEATKEGEEREKGAVREICRKE